MVFTNKMGIMAGIRELGEKTGGVTLSCTAPAAHMWEWRNENV